MTRWMAVMVIGAGMLVAASGASLGQNAGANQGGGAGGGGPQLTPEQQEQVQALQSVRDQAIQNMQNQGIDPQQMGNQIRQQMQNGTFDPGSFIQQLQQQGIINQGMLQQVQGAAQSLTLSTVRQALASPDDEWAILQPKLQRLLSARADADQNVTINVAVRFISGSNQDTPAQAAMKDLQAEFDNPQGTTARLAEKLLVWRQLHARAKAELQAAIDDLTGLLTLRQEAILVNIGLL